jgi:glutamyl-tRNA synthetase
MNVRTRVAPSPTGDPHVGTAYVALVNLCFAKRHGGEFVLRIEDTDRVRSTRESEDAILRSLHWLGLNWDGEPFRQSERSEIYREHVRRLLDNGNAFRCFCTAERLEEMRVAQRAAKEPPRYDGHCLSLTQADIEKSIADGVPFTIRLKVPSQGACVFTDLLRGRIEIEWKSVDMQVLMKSDGFPTYHLANVVDDHLMGITHVIRGEEWISSAPKHILLYQYFGWETPQICHLPLLRNPDKSKLSKRKNPTSILYYRERGYLAEALLHFLGMLVDGRNDDSLLERDSGIESLIGAMTGHFELEHISLGGPVFDMAKLNWLNGQHIRKQSVEQFVQTLADFGYAWPASIPQEQREHIARVAQPRIETLADFGSLVEFFGERPSLGKADFTLPKLPEAECKRALELASERLTDLAENAWTQSAIGEKFKSATADGGWKFRDIARLFYVAVTGSPTSVPLFDAMEILGKTESLRRLRIALEVLG